MAEIIYKDKESGMYYTKMSYTYDNPFDVEIDLVKENYLNKEAVQFYFTSFSEI